MKQTLCILALLAGLFRTIPNLPAQGTVYFHNYAPTAGLDAPILDVGGVPLSSSDYSVVAQLLGGPSPDNLVSLSPLVRVNADGYFDMFHETAVIGVPHVAPGESGYFKVQVWSWAGGNTWDKALAKGARHGESGIFTVIAGGDTDGGTHPPTFPAFLTGLQSIILVDEDPPIVPEPATIVLWLIGLAALGTMRMKRTQL